MNEGMISKRYAKALLQYANENKSEGTVYKEMELLTAIYASEPMLRMAMDNPTLNLSDKLNLIKTALGGNPSKEVSQFVKIVLENRREKFLRHMALSFIDLYCLQKQINVGKLITATPVDKSVEEKMKSLLTKIKPGGTLNFNTVVDPSIEGGFILFIDTYRLDASISTQLKRIKQQFILENSKIL